MDAAAVAFPTASAPSGTGFLIMVTFLFILRASPASTGLVAADGVEGSSSAAGGDGVEGFSSAAGGGAVGESTYAGSVVVSP